MAVQVVVVLAVLMAAVGFLLLVASLMKRRTPGTAGPGAHPVIVTPAEPDQAQVPAPPRVAAYVPESQEVAVNRRSFMNRAWLLAMTIFGVGFGTTSLAFLWPPLTGGFGGRVRLDKRLSDIKTQIRDDKKPFYSPEGRFYLVLYDTSDPENPYVKAGVAANGILALFQKCAHLGCRVPFCESAQWFECPCHGSRYNIAGEIQAGPAPAGLWRFPIEIDGEVVTVDTGMATAQPPKGGDTIRQPPAGSHCV